MTANAFDEERQRCIDAGMDDHINKPVSAEQLFLTLHAWLSGQHEVRGRNDSLIRRPEPACSSRAHSSGRAGRRC